MIQYTIQHLHLQVSINGDITHNEWFIMENPIKFMTRGSPPFQETSILGVPKFLSNHWVFIAALEVGSGLLQSSLPIPLAAHFLLLLGGEGMCVA